MVARLIGWLVAGLLVVVLVNYALRDGSVRLAGLRLLSESEYQRLTKTTSELQSVQPAHPVGQISGSYVIDSATELVWSKDLSPNSMTWSDALRFCEEYDLSGFDDWRLPNKVELETLALPRLVDGKVAQLRGEDPLGVIVPGHPKFLAQTGYLFSSSLVGGSLGAPWLMNLRNGHVFNGEGYNGYARCVRNRSEVRAPNPAAPADQKAPLPGR